MRASAEEESPLPTVGMGWMSKKMLPKMLSQLAQRGNSGMESNNGSIHLENSLTNGAAGKSLLLKFTECTSKLALDCFRDKLNWGFPRDGEYARAPSSYW